MSSAQRPSRQDAFARYGFLEGYPLWNPAPVLLPQRRRQPDGLKIGDVGIVDGDGCFSSLFNICHPRDSVLEDAYGFPTIFTRIKTPVVIDHTSFPSGHVFSSPETPWVHKSVKVPHRTSGSDRDVSRVVTQYTANLSEDGAHIIVPQGAKSSRLALQDHHLFEGRANSYGTIWLDFVSDTLQRPLSSIHLVTGLCRARSWSLALFNNEDGQNVPVVYEMVEQDKRLQLDASRWTPPDQFASAVGPSSGGDEHGNQVVFIQSFTITSNDIVRRANKEQRAPLGQFDATAQASRQTGSSAGVYHPSEVINRYLLMKQPSAKVAVTHDNIWLTMLTRGHLLKLQDLESSLDAIVSEHYTIVLRNGVIYLRKKDISLVRFGVDRLNLPIDLTYFIQQDDKEPSARYRFGTVYKGSLRIHQGSTIKVGIKILTTETTNDDSLSYKEMQVQRMIEDFTTLDHINVLPLIWTAVDSGRFTMVSPWADKGTLTSYINGMWDRLTDVQILSLIHDVAAGLRYLHSNDILHGNLSGWTVVIDANGAALLSEFGLSALMDEHGVLLLGQSEPEPGAVRWTAPELIGEGGNLTRDIPTKGSDIYSFGCIMLQILSGIVPYYNYERDEGVLSAVSRGETPKRPHGRRITDHRWGFIQQCWSSSSTTDIGLLSDDVVELAKKDLKLAIDSHQDAGVRVDNNLPHQISSRLDNRDLSTPIMQPGGYGQAENETGEFSKLLEKFGRFRIPIIGRVNTGRMTIDDVLKSIPRHEIRAFKKTWAMFSNRGAGLLERHMLTPFLARLDGIFEVRIYPPEFSIASILAVSMEDNQVRGVSRRKLNRALNKIDFGTVRRRRAVYMRIYHEANVLCHRNNGMSFTNMLALLAHHTLIDDEETLELKELEARREMLKLVDDLVALDKIRSRLQMLFHRRRYLAMSNWARAEKALYAEYD